MNNLSDSMKKRIDIAIKVVLIIIIILLLIHNCTLIKKYNKYKNKQGPNGNVDIIEIDCDNNQCKPTDDDPKVVSSLKFAQKSVSVKKGNKQKLIVLLSPSFIDPSKLTWTSSDESIAKVDNNGVITGLKEGQVTITVTGPNGISATCTLNITLGSTKVNKIVLNPTNITIKAGDRDQIVSKIEPENATERNIIWVSSDSSIVTVDDNGVIKGLKPGTATITVKTKDGKVSSTCTVTVEEVKVDSIILNPSKMSLSVGSSGQIVATIKPNNATYKDIIWTSSDESIATVDSTGKVTGIKEGTALITAKTKDGKIVATCTVDVKTAVIDAIGIVLSMENTNVIVGTYEQVIATIKPENATERELIWTSSDESIAIVDSTGKVTGIKEETVVITAKTKDGKVSSTINVTVKNATYDGNFETYDEEKDPISWNGSNDLKIFSKSIYNVDGVIAPESENTYQFVVRNNTKYKIKYNIDFIETNDYNINMQYKLKKNDTYIISNYTRANNMNVQEYVLNSGESDTYYLDWKWISSSNDTQIGAEPEVMYKLQIEVKAESING